MKQFNKEYKNWTLSNDDRIHITMVESKGHDLGDMLTNAMIYAEDWHGNTVDLSVEDLSLADYDELEEELAEYLAV